jgi:recombination protein RecA
MSKNVTLDNEKKKALDLALSAIEKQFGKGAVMRMDPTQVTAVPLLSSGIPSVDLALSGKYLSLIHI